MKREEVQKIVKLITQWLKEKRVGSITVNFFKGGISSIKKDETVKLSELEFDTNGPAPITEPVATNEQEERDG